MPTDPRQLLRRLFEEHHGELCAFACRYLASEEDAADVVQEVFVRVWSRRSERRLDDISRAYLYRAVRNEALNRRKARERRGARESGLLRRRQPSPPDEELRDRELVADVERALSELAPRCREIFLLVREDRLTYREAADVLDLSESTVATQMGRALRKLRRSLSNWLE